jgi:outer membrane protein OmpA-like peptidoglycan-associated protein
MSTPQIRSLPTTAATLTLALAAALAACTTPPHPAAPARPGAAPPPATTPAPAGAAPAPATTAPPGSAAAPERAASTPAGTVAAERQWLQSWFDGTPVQISAAGGDTIAVEVPLQFCFDAGSSVVKPALAAVLSKLSQSVHRLRARVDLIAAPADSAAAGAALALQRGGEVHKALGGHGIRATQLAQPSVASAASVQLRVVAAR